MMPIIFQANYIENEWMSDDKKFDIMLAKEEEKVKNYDVEQAKKIRNRIKKLLGK